VHSLQTSVAQRSFAYNEPANGSLEQFATNTSRQ